MRTLAQAGYFDQTRLSPSARLAMLLLAAGIPLGVGVALAPLQTILVVACLATVLAAIRQERAWLILVAIFLVVQDPLQILVGFDTPLAKGIKYADEFLVLLTAVYCVVAHPPSRLLFRNRGLAISVGLGFAGMVVSSLLAGSQALPALFDFAMLCKPFLILSIGASLCPSDTDIQRALPAVVGLMMAVVLSSLYFIAFPELQSEYLVGVKILDERLGMVSVQGFFINLNAYAWFSAATLCVSYAAFLAFRKKQYLFASIVAAMFVVLTWRRKTLLAVASVVLLSMVLRRLGDSRRRAIAVGLIALLACATVLAPYLDKLWNKTIEEYGSSDPYATARHALYYGSVVIAQEHFPFGTGLASFGGLASRVYYSDVYADYGLARVWGLSPQAPHFITDTFWPMVLGQGGIVSLLGYVGFFWILARRIAATLQVASATSAAGYLSLVALFLLGASLVESTASPIYCTSLLGSLALLPAGMAWRQAEELSQGARDTVDSTTQDLLINPPTPPTTKA